MKLGSVSSWGRMPEYQALVKEVDAASGPPLTGDCYAYDFWHSTLRVLVLSRRYGDPAEVRRGLDDNGGPENVILARYAPRPVLRGQVAGAAGPRAGHQTLQPVHAADPRDQPPVAPARVGRDIREHPGRLDARAGHPRLLPRPARGRLERRRHRGQTPRGAGAMPRFLARYVRGAGVLGLPEGLRRLTSLPASILGLKTTAASRPG